MRRLLVAVASVLALVACVGDPPPPPPEGVDPVATPDPDATAIPSEPALAMPDRVEEDCPEALVDEARCGLLIVPEDRDDPSGPVVEVAWARLPAAEPGPSVRDVPLVVLPDGPGLGVLEEEGEAWLDSPLRQDREVILLDPRGTGLSFPSLDCGQPPRPGALPLDLVEDCRRTLEAEGIGLHAYDTGAIAADVVDLVGALDLAPVDLLGVGHGARVALEVVRRAPDLLDAVVLDSPVPTEVDVLAERPANAAATLNRLLDECVERPGCPGDDELPAEVVELVRALDATPFEVAAGEVVTGEDVVLAALAALRGGEGPGAVPAALARAVAGEPDAALARLQEVAARGAAVPESAFSEGLRLSAGCRDEAPGTGASPEVGEGGDPIARAVAADIAELLAACAIWDVGEAPPESREPVTGGVPALVLVGEFDPISTPAWAAGVASRLDRAQVVQVGGAGHRVHDVDDCTTDLVAGFLQGPRRPVDGTCAADRPLDLTAG